MYSRRDFGKLAGLMAAAIPLRRLDAAAKADSTIRGVLILRKPVQTIRLNALLSSDVAAE